MQHSQADSGGKFLTKLQLVSNNLALGGNTHWLGHSYPPGLYSKYF
jgi:hypothetical protein